MGIQREDVIETLRKLRKELAENPNSWENPTLGEFLEAMEAWLEDTSHKNGQTVSWELIQDMLIAGQIYE